MTEPKDQAVPVVGVEEAIANLIRQAESMERIAARQYGPTPMPEFAEDAKAIRTILQALQGSSFANAQDTHRATEQPVVGDRGALKRVDAFVQQWEARIGQGAQTGDEIYAVEVSGFGGMATLLCSDLRKLLSLGQQSAVSDAAQVGTQSRSDEVNQDLQAQLKAAYEAMEEIGSIARQAEVYHYTDGASKTFAAIDTLTRQALARRGEGQ